ncbi:MAG: PAS domain S-box protein [Acidimicrobiales bacterium]|nr:PAS domain S-box protein [Acidimicrobiales bacterium]
MAKGLIDMSTLRPVAQQHHQTEPGSAEQIDTLLRLMPDAAVVADAAGKIVAANSGAESLFGYPPAALIGIAVDSLVPERFRSRHGGRRAAYVTRPVPRPMGAGHELWANRLDGSEFPADISLTPIDRPEGPCTLAVVRDLTVQRAAWEAGAWLASIVSSSEDAIVSMDLNGTLTTWNPGAERLLGYSTDEICGKPFSRLVPENLRPDVEAQIARVCRGVHMPTGDTVRLHKTGLEIEVSESLSLIRKPSGTPTGVSAVLRDITERKRADRELRRLLVDGQRRERWLGSISEVRLAMLAGGGLEQWLDLIARRASELSDADGITVSVVADDDDSLLEVIATHGKAVQRLRGRRFPIKGSVAGRVFTSGRSSLAADPSDLLSTDQADAVPTGLGPLLFVSITTLHGSDGVLGVVRSAGRATFGPEEIRVVESFGQQAGLAIELDRAHGDRERLAALSERERIARDLHDHVIQRLFAVGMALQAASRSITDQAALGRIGESIEELDATIRDVRSTIFSLAVRTSDRVGMNTRSRLLDVTSLAAQGLGFQPRLLFDGPVDTKVPEDLVPDALAVVREGLSNAARHAKASRVEVRVDVHDGLSITVTDNGIGMGDSTRSSGLANLRARAVARGGSMTVGKGDDRGTRLHWQVPLGP